MNFKKSILATIIGSSLASTSIAAVANSTNLKIQTSPVGISSSKMSFNGVATKTATGMKSQYDKTLGKATFEWASINQEKPDLGPIDSKYRVSYAADFYLNKLIGMSTAKQGVSRPILASVHDSGRGANIAKYKQTVANIEVFNREYNIMMDQELNLVASSGYLFTETNSSSLSSSLSSSVFGDPATAISAAFSDLGGDSNDVVITKKDSSSDSYTKFEVSNKSDIKKLIGEPRAKKVYFEIKGKLQAAYYVEVETALEDSVSSDYYGYVIDATSGKVLFKNNLASHAEDFTYRVYADQTTKKPWDGPHGNVIPAVSADTVDATAYLEAPLITLTSGPISTNDPWLDDGATITAGNNVTAYVDAIAPDGFTAGDFVADVTNTNTFDYAYDTNLAEYSVHNRKAAIVNLFYLNNYLHDDFYDHGFDEASGNAQNVNYERGGVEGDALRAEVQDNSGFDNANMSTPADGASPRMQMYLFDSKDAVIGEDYGITITSHDDIGLLDITQRASFGQGQFNIIGDVVIIDDATDTATDGCETASNATDLVGKIAIIDRGACAFTVKVKNAQDAGAIAVIIANNADDDTPAPMGGTDDTVTIPSMGITFADGAAIYAKLATETVSISMFNDKPYKGSSWDNGIVAHEWGHYISNRLVGNASGLTNQQGRSMGEGWGDFHALLLLSDADDALITGNELFGTAYSATSYVANFQTGIRNYPYSTDMEVNPLTFANVTLNNGTRADTDGNAEVHDAGEPWAVMLWDSYVALINDERHTFAEAQSLMKDYLVAGYKMTPIAPTYTEARDAILAAAYANDPEDYNLILAAFARRGMGLGAVSPVRTSTDHEGVVESYEVTASTFSVSSHQLDTNYEGVTSGYCSNDSILDKGETGTVSFTVTNKGSTVLAGLTGKVVVTSGHDVTFANDGVITFGDVDLYENITNEPLEFTLNDANTADTLAFEITFPDLDDETTGDTYQLSTTVNVDFKERDPVNNASTDTVEDFSLFINWQEHVMTGGDAAVGSQTFDTVNTTFFESYGYDLGSQTMLLLNNAFESDVALETKPFTVGYAGSFEMSFWHFYALEEDYDGGVVEISVNGDEWVDVTEMGGTFDVGYTGEVFEQDPQVLSGRPVYHGRNDEGAFGGMERISFGTALNGNEVQLRFRVGSDSSASDIGWFIDNVTFKNILSPVFSDLVAGDTFACDNRAPDIAAVSDIEQEVDEGTAVSLEITATDANSDTLSFVWTQVSGTSVELTNSDSTTVSFTAPLITEDSEDLIFTATVSDGVDASTQSFTVTVNDVAEPVEEKKSSSGGSTSLFALLLLPLALLRRRK